MPVRNLPSTLKTKPTLCRTEVSVNWSSGPIQRLLRLISDDDRYRRAFFPTGMIKYKVCDIARELCIELMEDEPEYMEMLEGRDQVVRDADGNWVLTDTWTSSYNNPVVTKFHDLKKRYKLANKTYNIRSSWTDFSQVSAGLRKDFRTSYPWFFTFKALVEGHEPSAVPRLHTTSTSANAASSSRQSQATSTRKVVQAGPSTTAALPVTSTSNPFSNLRPTSSRPEPDRTASSSMPSAPRPTAHTTHGAGSSSQIPIDIELDSVASDEHQDDANRSNEIIDLTSPKPKKSSKKNSRQFRSANGRLTEEDKSNLKKLENQLRIATRKKLEIRTTKVPKVFSHVSTERNRYMKAEDDVVKNEILRRARIHLIFRVLRDLDAFILPSCLDDCGVLIDRLFEMNRSARADQLRRTVEQAGGSVYKVECDLASDTNRSLRIYVYDDSQARADTAGKLDSAENDQGLEHLEYTILEFGRFLRQRLFPSKK